MNRTEYLERLAFLLQDIPVEEREEALEYYKDYFEEAGPENEQKVIEELGSPEKVAAMIRDSVKGNVGEDEYTENGYYNRRYDEKNKMPGKRKKESWHLKGDRNRNIVLLILIVVLACGSALPAIAGTVFGLGGGLLGLAGGFLGVFVGLGGGCIGFIGGGIGLMIAGIVKMFTVLPTGLLMLGGGLLMTAFGFVLLLFWVWMIARLLPALVRAIVRVFRKLFHRGGETL